MSSSIAAFSQSVEPTEDAGAARVDATNSRCARRAGWKDWARLKERLEEETLTSHEKAALYAQLGAALEREACGAAAIWEKGRKPIDKVSMLWEAIDAYAHAVTAASGDDKQDAPLLARKARLLSVVGDDEAALVDVRRSIAMGNGENARESADAHFVKATVLSRKVRRARALQGHRRGDGGDGDEDGADADADADAEEAMREDIEEAILALEEALALYPKHARAMHALTMIVRPVASAASADDVGSRNLERMLRMEEDIAAAAAAADGGESDTSRAEEMHLHFGLFNALSRIPDRDADAWAHLKKANAIAHEKRQPVSHDEREYLRLLSESFTAWILKAELSSEGVRDELPIFLVGMPFSGTSLVEATLAQSMHVHLSPGTSADGNIAPSVTDISETVSELLSMLEANADVGQHSETRHRIARDYLRRLRATIIPAGTTGTGITRVVDNSFTNIYVLGFIALLLPAAKIVHVTRDPIRTCVQAYTHVFDADFSSDANSWTSDQRTLARKYKLYTELMSFWRSVLPQDIMLEVAYEDLVTSDFDSGMRRVFEFVGVESTLHVRRFWESQRRTHLATVSTSFSPSSCSSSGCIPAAIGAELGDLVDELDHDLVGPDTIASFAPAPVSQIRDLHDLTNPQQMSEWIRDVTQRNRLRDVVTDTVRSHFAGTTQRTGSERKAGDIVGLCETETGAS